MKKFRRICRYNILPFIIIVSVGLGAVGYFMYYNEVCPSTNNSRSLTNPVLEALYSTLRLFIGNTDATRNADSPYALCYSLIEAARFLALIATGTALWHILSPHLRNFRARLFARHKNSLALHGSVSLTEAMAKAMPSYVLLKRDGSPAMFKAKTQIVAFEKDEQAIQFIQEKQLELFPGLPEKRPLVYLCVHSPWLNIAAGSHMKISCMAFNCARVYWEKHYLPRFTGRCVQKEDGRRKRSKILIFGFGDYGEALLSQALLVNVFLPGTPGVEYHVFGDGSVFQREHAKLPQLLNAEVNDPCKEGDSLNFHEAEDFAFFEKEYADADRIILAHDDDADNILLFSFLCTHFAGLPEIYIRLREKRLLEIMAGSKKGYVPGEPLYNTKYKVFGTNKELYTEKVIIKEKLLKRAKLINEWYGKRSQGGKPWEEIGLLEQYSNLAAADHFSVKIRQLLGRDVAMDKNSLAEYKKKYDTEKTSEYFRDFLRMEHKRWMRFYFFMGWSYAGEKDKTRHLHDNLKDFCELDQATQNIDMDSYKALRAIRL